MLGAQKLVNYSVIHVIFLCIHSLKMALNFERSNERVVDLKKYNIEFDLWLMWFTYDLLPSYFFPSITLEIRIYQEISFFYKR